MIILAYTIIYFLIFIAIFFLCPIFDEIIQDLVEDVRNGDKVFINWWKDKINYILRKK